MDKYEFNVIGTELYSFIWNDFCDWYIELSKTNMNNTTKSVLLKTLSSILKMLHPFMPYVTEEIYQMLPIKDAKSIMISNYPIYQKEFVFEESKELDKMIEFIIKVRNAKQEHQIPSSSKVYFKGNNIDIIIKLLKINKENLTEKSSQDGIEIKTKDYEIKYIFDTSITQAKEKENILKEKERLEKSIMRRENLLSNTNYINKAPQKIIEEEKNSLAKEKEQLELILNMTWT